MCRLEQLNNWVNHKFDSKIILNALNNDASFRRYYRFSINGVSYVAVDSPPSTEKNQEFVIVHSIFKDNNINVADIIYHDINNGYFILEDLSDGILLPLLEKIQHRPSADNSIIIPELYKHSLDELTKIALCDRDTITTSNYNIPDYSTTLVHQELELFREWFLTKYLQLSLTKDENDLLDSIFKLMQINFAQQPVKLVHRDYHSRNLIFNNDQVWVIDFQDAVWGPITYDLVSLFRDCYIAWPLEDIKKWVHEYYYKILAINLIDNITFDQYWHWFIKTCLQRNFKTIGIFARLYLRDSKDRYLSDIPRTFNYMLEAEQEVYKYSKDINDRKLYQQFYSFLKNRVQSKVVS